VDETPIQASMDIRLTLNFKWRYLDMEKLCKKKPVLDRLFLKCENIRQKH